MTTTSRPLTGLKVLEVGNWVAVPAAGAVLADMGADVSKIEHPVTGDPVRGLIITTRGARPYQDGLNHTYEMLNRGKRSVAVNLEQPAGRDVVRKLAAGADVMLTNLLPGRQERYGLRYEDLEPLNPRLVYAVLTGYGMEGPHKDRTGFDYTAFWARSGIMATLGERDEMPVQQRPGFGDMSTCLSLVSGIGVALYERERSGRGQRVECSLLHNGVWAVAMDFTGALRERKPIVRNSRRLVANPLFNYYRTKDGYWIGMVMPDADRFWPGFCRALDLDDLIDDPRFVSLGARAKNATVLVDILDERFAAHDLDEWTERLDAERCIWGHVQTLDKTADDPQVRANGYLARMEHETDGPFEVLNPPMKLSRTPGAVGGLSEAVGASTEQALLDAGYTWDDIAALKDEGAII